MLGERTKNSLPHEIYLAQSAREALPPRRDGDPFVFGKTKDAGYSGWSRSKDRLDGRLKLEPWSLHDFWWDYEHQAA